MTGHTRRRFLKITLAGACWGLLMALPRMAAAAWPAGAFRHKTVAGALNELLGNANLTTATDEVKITVTDLAENGSVVPVTIESRLANVDSIILFVDKNPSALVARFNLAPNVRPFIKTNIKMAETSHVIAIAQSGGKLYSTKKKVKVVLNGCGG